MTTWVVNTFCFYVPNVVPNHKIFPRNIWKCNSVPWPEPNLGDKQEKEDRQRGERDSTFGGVVIFLPLIHLRKDHTVALTSMPEKYLPLDDLVVLKFLRRMLKKQNLSQAMWEMDGNQLPARRGPTEPEPQSCGSTNICQPRSYVTMVKDFQDGEINRRYMRFLNLNFSLKNRINIYI